MPYALLLILAAALIAVIVIGEKRHARIMRRLRRFEKSEMDLLRLRRTVYADRAAAACRAAGREPTLPLLFTSQFGEDIFLWDLFGGALNGTFIEVGGHDGFTDAVTYPFEAAGWTGLLVEPMPDRFEQCRALRNRSRVVHAALSKRGSAGTATMEVLEQGRAGEDPVAKLTGATFQGAYTSGFQASGKRIEVPLTSMDAVLESSGIAPGSIDFAVLDVEGAEPDLLDGFDLNKWRPRVLIVEDLAMTEVGGPASLRKLIEPYGYTQAMWLAYNRVFIRSDERELLARARDLSAKIPIPSRSA